VLETFLVRVWVLGRVSENQAESHNHRVVSTEQIPCGDRGSIERGIICWKKIKNLIASVTAD